MAIMPWTEHFWIYSLFSAPAITSNFGIFKIIHWNVDDGFYIRAISIHVFDVSLGGGAGLSMGVPPQIHDLYLDFTFQSLEVNFENLLGGGSLEALIETVINELGRLKVFHLKTNLSPLSSKQPKRW